LRTENQYWRECVSGIVRDAAAAPVSGGGLAATLEQRLAALGEKIGRLHRA
jgi:hypothetical protein